MRDDRTVLLSVVVPALNEERSIIATLDRLVGQEAVDEIIVVDNGSTDETRGLVEKYTVNNPKVRLLIEPRRGLPFARNTGFDAARGEFIGRTDADTLVLPDWGETIKGYLAENPEVAAVTGITTYHDSPVGFLLHLGYWIQDRRGQLGNRVGNLHGPNMGIRRSAWLEVRDQTMTKVEVAEDLDLALCLIKKQLPIQQLKELRADTSARRRRATPREWWRFQLTGLDTIRGQGFWVLPMHRRVIVGAWLAHTVQWPIYLFWDFDRRRFTLRPTKTRISSIGH
ncbi:glycosyltransferase [Nocardia sp. SYP-A9097]|uniref:glycosyltransferase family 2 protein n=1 Tax=Nocardia sp. SYP-A9097 TaxID=2663237 RepID=UPI00129A89DA|nr:glycosyltransferase family 2 protein [Nocardia sp. SYP-A9097]MRH87579.1 glycosyltransferase [Nocardia sp. SYP-A9097]